MSSSPFGKVAVLFGGNSSERPVSLNSGAAVLKALLESGVDAHRFDPAEQPVEHLKDYDRAFIVLHGRGGEDGQIQGLLEWLDIPYTGSGILPSALGMDKSRTKQLWMGCGLPTAPYVLLTASTPFEQVASQIGLPFIIKPVHEGSSIGMSKVERAEDYPAALERALAKDAVVMAEKWIQGKEFTVVILNDQALPVIRLQPPKDAAFYDYDSKYERNDTRYGIPSGLSPAAEAQLQQLALSAFRAVGAHGWGRIDAMQDEAGHFWLLEINTVPGMTSHSLVPMAAQATGLSFNDLCLEILQQTNRPPAG